MLQQREPVIGSATLVGDRLVIRRQTKTRGLIESFYRLQWLSPDPEVGTRAVRLTGLTGKSYDCVLFVDGPHCDCPDFHQARQNKDPKGCKHLAALRATGVINDLPPQFRPPVS